jgi:hypothetical protein
MGIGGSKFERNDKIPGQGLQVLVDAKQLKIKATQLDRIFHEFHKLSGEETLVEYDGFLSFLEVENVPWTDLLFKLMDMNKDGEFNFWEYMICCWNFLSASEDNLPATLFTIFDYDGNGVLEVFEVKYMLQLIYVFKPPLFARWAIEKLDMNEEGLVTIAEFVLLCRHHPVLLAPILTMQKGMRKRIVHSRFWREIARMRVRDFGSYSFFDILVIKNAREIKLNALKHLATREDIPLAYKDKWADLVIKREEMQSMREKLVADLPPETLTDVQMGIRLMFPATYQPASKKDRGAFAHLHPDFNDDAAMLESNEDRVNRLVDSLKAQHARIKASSKKKSDKESKSTRAHASVKAVTPGIPTIAGPEPVRIKTGES